MSINESFWNKMKDSKYSQGFQMIGKIIIRGIFNDVDNVATFYAITLKFSQSKL